MVVKKQDEDFNAESLQAIGIILQQGDPESLSLDPLRGEMRDFCRRIVVGEKFKAESGSLLVIPLADKNVRCVVLAGTGSESESTTDAVREAAFRVTRAAASKGLSSLSLTMARPQDERRARAAAEGAVLAGYRFSKYIEKDEKDRFAAPETVVIVDGNEKGIAEGGIMAEAQCWTRDIANEPGNVINPVALAAKAASSAFPARYGTRTASSGKIWALTTRWRAVRRTRRVSYTSHTNRRPRRRGTSYSSAKALPSTAAASI